MLKTCALMTHDKSTFLNKTLSGPAITKDEIRKVVFEAKKNNAAVSDELPIEILTLDDNNI